VYADEASCVTLTVKEDTPFVGTFVKSISVTLSVRVNEPVLPLAKSIATTPDDDHKATSVSA